MRNIDEYTKKYYAEPGERYQVKYRKKKILEIMKQYNHFNILEIGCGLDPIFQYINEFKCMTIVEPSKEFYDNAVALAKGRNDIKCINAYFEDYVNLKNCQVNYDFIILSSLIHELENPSEFLQAVKKICLPTTIVHVNVPNAYSIHRILAKGMGIIEDVHQLSVQQIDMQRHHVFDAESLNRLVMENGFIVLESGSYFPKFLSGAQMDLMVEKGIISEKIYDGLYCLGEYLANYGSELYVQLRIEV